MWTEQELSALEQDERKLTLEEIALMLLILQEAKALVESDITLFYQKYGKNNVVTYAESRKWVSLKDRRRRWVALVAVIGEHLRSQVKSLESHFKELELKLIKKELSFFNIDIPIDDLTYAKWGTDLSYWKPRLWDDESLWENYISVDLRRAFVRGDALEDVLNQLGKRFQSMETILRRLGITESTAISSSARKAIFKKLGIEKYRWYTREDERTCETCGAMHGLVFPISAYAVGITAPCLHPNCRCWTEPILD